MTSMRRSNPFKPTAGRMPPLLIGRDAIIDDFEEGLDDGPGAPGRLMRVTGARGVGKTVILTEFGRIAKPENGRSSMRQLRKDWLKGC